MAVQENKIASYDDELLPDLEMSIIPCKISKKMRVEFMDEDFVAFAQSKNIIDSDMLFNITWTSLKLVLDKLMGIYPEYVKGRK